jgi:hypothetical protein
MTGTKMPSLQDRPALLDISQVLHFWHKVEFFIPFDLQQQVLEARDADWAVRSWSLQGLPRGTDDLWTFKVPRGRKLVGFDIYLGVFDKSVLTGIVRDVLSKQEEFEQDERGELEGLTCMAKVKAGPSGEPLLKEVSVSTVPWALGRVRTKGLVGLDFDVFQDGTEALKLDLQQFRTVRMAEAGAQPPDGEDEKKGSAGKPVPVPLSGDELRALLALFQRWAGYGPEALGTDQPILVIRAKSVEDRKKEGAPATSRETVRADEDDEFEDDEAELEIDILNSFFAQDIARAILSLERQEDCAALKAYLSPIPEDRRLDLYSAKGRAHIRRTLSPARLPAGHWPDEPAHAMSLMQQFAINSLLERLDGGGIFSVNGPPGTGKTTLLRDVFAELITRRARALAALPSPQSAFTGRRRVEFRDRTHCYVSSLRKELTGFEMVVASSNNAAVENLSRDLPKSKALGQTAWRDEKGDAKVRYLQTIAHNIAAYPGKRGYLDLSGKDGRGDDVPWGLIAGALGKKANRSRFSDGLGKDGSNKDPRPKGFDPELHQSVWSWRARTDIATFVTARDAFITADRAVSQRVAALERYAELEIRLRGQTLETFIASAEAALGQARSVVAGAEAELGRLAEEVGLCNRQLDVLRENELVIEAGRPAWWARWFQPKRERCRKAELETVRQQKKGQLDRLYHAQDRQERVEARLAAAQTELGNAEATLAYRRGEWRALQAEWRDLSVTFPRVRLPSSDEELEQDRWQIDGLWRDDTLNLLRSQLFAAALGLHEAWLADVVQQKSGFGGNVLAIVKLLSGTRPSDSEDALAIWQSLFMMVPVVSSTFASIAAQFRELGPESIGWLFIDEAGQAVPQAAVGALWRSKRAVVVGDPMQIEPVFTVPIRLIDALAREAGLTCGAKVAPHQVSVQNLADDANSLGALVPVGGELQWIGSPLRVHRRCVDPMFTIANAIAYQNKMIFFDPDRPQSRLPPAGTLDLGPSAWVCLGGATLNKQVVPEQVEFACQAVQTLYRRTGKLPDLYVISPFRRIKQALIDKIADLEQWPSDSKPNAGDLKDWCKARIGTVHTFQGKEESVVLMVLGCDQKNIGAARWAANKPNLLNVALTRSKHRFFMVGDEALWAGLPNFSDAGDGLLPRITPETFLKRAQGERAPTRLPVVRPFRKLYPASAEGGSQAKP